MKEIKYVTGDATAPIGNKGIIAHVCNDVNSWGAGFVLALSKKWKQPEEEFHRIPKANRVVGNIQLVLVGENLIVANMIAQNGTGYNKCGVPAVNYAAIEVTMNRVCGAASSMNVDVHIPRIGCSLAGGSWEVVELILKRVLRNHNCDIIVYDFEGGMPYNK